METRSTQSFVREAYQAAREGRYATAVQTYLFVAAQFAEQGFALKALSQLRQVVDIVDRQAPELADSRKQALERMVSLFTELGLEDDAEETRKRLREG